MSEACIMKKGQIEIEKLPITGKQLLHIVLQVLT